MVKKKLNIQKNPACPKEGKNLIALNAENPHKKSSKCIKMSEKNYGIIQSLIEHGSIVE